MITTDACFRPIPGNEHNQGADAHSHLEAKDHPLEERVANIALKFGKKRWWDEKSTTLSKFLDGFTKILRRAREIKMTLWRETESTKNWWNLSVEMGYSLEKTN